MPDGLVGKDACQVGIEDYIVGAGFGVDTFCFAGQVVGEYVYTGKDVCRFTEIVLELAKTPENLVQVYRLSAGIDGQRYGEDRTGTTAILSATRAADNA